VNRQQPGAIRFSRENGYYKPSRSLLQSIPAGRRGLARKLRRGSKRMVGVLPSPWYAESKVMFLFSIGVSCYIVVGFSIAPDAKNVKRGRLDPANLHLHDRDCDPDSRQNGFGHPQPLPGFFCFVRP